MNNNKKERKQQEQQRHSNSEITRGKKLGDRKRQNIGDSKISFFERGNKERKSLKKAPFVYSEAQKHLQA